MTTEDVKASWDRASSKESTNKPQSSMPVEKVEYPDASTIVFTMSKPAATFLDVLADTNVFWIMPKEAFNGGFDPAKISIGSGPWVWKDYQPSVKHVMTRNPNWHMGGAHGAPFFDGVETAIIPEYANRLAQFLAGNLDLVDVNADDLPSVIKQVSGAKIKRHHRPNARVSASSIRKPQPPGSPRTRASARPSRCASTADALTELGYNVNKLRAGGIKVKTPWNNLVPAGQTAWWMDPRHGDGRRR